MQLSFQIDSRSTHATPQEFYESLDDNQRDFYDFLNYLTEIDDQEGEIFLKLIEFLIKIWNDNEEIHTVIAAVANDYWRQFAFYRQPFDMVHYGQQLHILACVYNLCRSYINEHNMVKRGDLNHNDLPVYNAITKSFENENI